MAVCPPLESQFPDKNKKLINLSRQVLEKVKTTGVTTGNQIAKAILQDFSEKAYELEFKNIQRRVYDALNVLQAIDIISKMRNEVSYKGLINNEQIIDLKQTIESKKQQNELKKQALIEKMCQYIAIHKLIQRNKADDVKKQIVLPCVIVRGVRVNIEIQEDSARFTSRNPFKIINDSHLLSGLNLHRFSSEDLSEDFPNELMKLIHIEDHRESESGERDYREMLLHLTERR